MRESIIHSTTYWSLNELLYTIWNRLAFVLNLCQQAFKSYGLSRDMHEEREMVAGNMQLQTAL